MTSANGNIFIWILFFLITVLLSSVQLSSLVVVCISLWIQRTQYGMFTLTPCLGEMFGSNSFQRQHFQRITITTQRHSIAPGSYAQRCIASYARYHQCGNGNQCQTNLLLFVQRFVCKRLVKMKERRKEKKKKHCKNAYITSESKKCECIVIRIPFSSLRTALYLHTRRMGCAYTLVRQITFQKYLCF